MDSTAPQMTGQVAGELDTLARQGASGALQITGDPGGTIYLQEGYLAFAESAAVADLGSRLVNSRRLGADQWCQAQRDSQPDGCAGDALLSRGLIDQVEWHTLLRAAALDALLALALQLTADPSVAGTCFTEQQAPCVRSAPPMDARSAWAYARAEAERLAGQAIGPETRPQLADPGRDQLMSGGQAPVVLAQIDGRATLQELAWRNGLALYGVMDWVARMIHVGVCTVAGSPERARHRAAAHEPGPLLVSRPDRGRTTSAPDPPVSRWVPPDQRVMRRVLAGLRRLD